MSPSSRVRIEVQLRGISLLAGDDHGCGSLVLALRAPLRDVEELLAERGVEVTTRRLPSLTVATVELSIDVSVESASDDHARTEVPVAVGGPYAPPPDLDLRVTLTSREGRSVLSYVLHSPNGVAGYHYYPAGEVTLLGSPEQYHMRLMKRIEGLSGQAQTGLRAIGEQLYRELFPSELRRAYRDLSV